MKTKPHLIVFILLLSLLGCRIATDASFRKINKELPEELGAVNPANSYLKAHMKSGELYVFSGIWKLSEDQTILSGFAYHYDINRNLIQKKTLEIKTEDVAIYESSKPLTDRSSSSIAALTITTTGNVILGAFCLYNPKACFGSCPTFYYMDDHSVHYANAEGFSSSISPIMEKGDFDALRNPFQGPGEFVITMKNEALETHAINKVSLWAAPRLKNQTLLQTPSNKFFACSSPVPATLATAAGSNISETLQREDLDEYFSASHPTNLLQKETILLEFDNPSRNKQLAFTLNFRQTQLTTFLFYTILDYMGPHKPQMFAGIETRPDYLKDVTRPMRMLGGIEAEVLNPASGQWEKAGSFSEAGPIALNRQMLLIEPQFTSQEKIKIRLRMTQGLWRIDFAGLSEVIQAVEPFEILPHKASLNGVIEPEILKNLAIDDQLREVSFPGYVYQLHFQIPEGAEDYELFLYSSGYYLEWMRESWNETSDILSLKRFVMGDKLVWRKLAKEFKIMEPEMEAHFWNSRVNP